MNILLGWAINHVWKLENGASSEEITHLVKIARYVRFFNFDWIELVAEIRAARRPPRTGDTWIKLHMSVFGGWMELVAEVSCRVQGAGCPGSR
jgi:transcriptional regulator with XRE-family HTH domain